MLCNHFIVIKINHCNFLDASKVSISYFGYFSFPSLSFTVNVMKFMYSLFYQLVCQIFQSCDRANSTNMVALRVSIPYHILYFQMEISISIQKGCVFEVKFTPRIAHITFYVQPHMLHMEPSFRFYH